jgi:hypothetical protein
MDETDCDSIIAAAAELGQSHKEATELIHGMSDVTSEVKNLYDHGQGGLGKTLVGAGVSLVLFPEPTMLTDVIGCGIIAAGMLYQRVSPPPIYVDNVYSSIESQVGALQGMNTSITDQNIAAIDFPEPKLKV